MNILKNLWKFSLISILFLLLPLCGAEKGGKMREPAVAGQFYPGEKDELLSILELLSDKVNVEVPEGKIIGGVSPHAGYIYSGFTAMHLYKILKNKKFNTVIIVGPSHYIPFRGVSVYNTGSWKTPLGKIDIDEKIANSLIKRGEQIKGSPELHVREHSIEVQVPFLQYIKDNKIKIVPVMMGTQDRETIMELADAIYNTIKDREDVIVIASSDLYHGYSYNECERRDSLLQSYVEKMDIEGFISALQREEVMACGGGPIAVVMSVAKKTGADPLVLNRTNSNDVMGERGGYVVGYMSVAFVKKNEFSLSEDEKKFLLKLARKTLEYRLRGETPPVPEDVPEKLKMKMGVFTTLNKNHELRGCIGYPVPVSPLYMAVMETAEKAALEDPRFVPVNYNELKDIDIEITVLTPLQEVKNLDEIEVGRDGLLVKYGPYQGLLLPQVPVEYNWDRETFIKHTCLKAGLPPDAYKWEGVKFYKFQGIIFSESEMGLK